MLVSNQRRMNLLGKTLGPSLVIVTVDVWARVERARGIAPTVQLGVEVVFGSSPPTEWVRTKAHGSVSARLCVRDDGVTLSPESERSIRSMDPTPKP